MKPTEKELKAYAEQKAETIVIRSYDNWHSTDTRRKTTPREKEIIKSIIFGGLLAINQGADRQSVADACEYIGNIMLPTITGTTASISPSAYTRKQAIEDGLLVDVSKVAREAGFIFPVAITAGVHRLIENIPQSRSHQDYAGRLWDVLWMAAMTARHAKGTEVLYKVILHHIDRRGTRGVFRIYATLKMHIGPGDEGDPVITIMLPDED